MTLPKPGEKKVVAKKASEKKSLEKKPRNRVVADRNVRSSRTRSPLYQQVVSALREDILKGIYSIGSKLPAESVLTRRFEVSRHTVREALRQLRTDGIISSRQGAPSMVERPAASQAFVHEVDSMNDLISYAASYVYKVDTQQTITGDAYLREQIGADADLQWLRVEGFRYPAEALPPICWTKIYIPMAFANVGRLIGRGNGTVYGLIEDLHGVRIAEVTQVVKTSPAPAFLVEPLQVEKGSPLVELIRFYKLSGGAIAQIAVSYYPADRFSLSMTLRRAV